MTAPLTMREIMSETGHTLISPDVLTRAEDMALRMVATGTAFKPVDINGDYDRLRFGAMCRSEDASVAVRIGDVAIGLDAAEEVAITLLALVAVARRGANG